MEITIKRITDWSLVLDSALWTVNKEGLDKEPSDKFKRAIVISEHSPLRELRYHIEMKGIPNFSSQQISRHDNFAGHSHRDASKDQNYVGTSRSDRSDKKDKEVNRLTPIDHKISLSAQDFIELSKKRLCRLASKETRDVWQGVIDKLKEIDPILASACVPNCIYRNICPEHTPCGYSKTSAFVEARERYVNLIKQ